MESPKESRRGERFVHRGETFEFVGETLDGEFVVRRCWEVLAGDRRYRRYIAAKQRKQQRKGS